MGTHTEGEGWSCSVLCIPCKCTCICDPMDCSPPGFSVHGVLLEWVAISFSRGSSWPKDRTQVSCIAGRRFTLWATREAHTHNLLRKKNFLTLFLCIFLIFNFYFYFILLYNTVLVLPYIDMNPPRVYMSSQSWTPLPPPTPYHLSGSSPHTSPKHPVSCIEHRLAIHFLHASIHVSMPFSQIIPPSPSPSESKRLFYTSVSLLLSCIQGHHCHLSKFHIYVLVYCIGVTN